MPAPRTSILILRRTMAAAATAATAAAAGMGAAATAAAAVAGAAAVAAGLLMEAVDRRRHKPALVLLPASLWLGASWVETAVLAGVALLVLITELLNSAVEATVDRVGLEWHALAKQAKDLGSAAVLLALLLCAGTWGWALWARLWSPVHSG